MASTLILDTETCGISNNPATGFPDLIQLAYLKTNTIEELLNCAKPFPNAADFAEALLPSIFSKYFKPQQVIHPEATKIHGITFKMLVNEVPSKKFKEYLPKEEEIDFLICHNISFDYRVLHKPDIKCICTLSLSKTVDKMWALGFKNNQLDYLIDFFYQDTLSMLKTEFHSANYDVIKTVLLLIKLLSYLPDISSYEELYIFQQNLKKIKK